MNPTLKKLLLCFFVALTASLGCFSPAHAVIYKGSWDPNFGGAIFPYLGWRGSAEFILPPACIGMTGECTDPGMHIQNAVVEFYDNRDPFKATVQTLQFGSNVLILGMSVVTTDGVTNLTGADTGFFVPSVAGTATVAKYPYPDGADYFFHLIFAQDLAYLVYTDQATDSPVCASLHPVPVECGISQVDARITFRQIPEPATAALALIALTGLLGIRRQRR